VHFICLACVCCSSIHISCCSHFFGVVPLAWACASARSSSHVCLLFGSPSCCWSLALLLVSWLSISPSVIFVEFWHSGRAFCKWYNIWAWYGLPCAHLAKYHQYLIVCIKWVISGVQPYGLVWSLWHWHSACNIPCIHKVSMVSSGFEIALVRLCWPWSRSEIIFILLRRSWVVMHFFR